MYSPLTQGMQQLWGTPVCGLKIEKKNMIVPLNC